MNREDVRILMVDDDPLTNALKLCGYTQLKISCDGLNIPEIIREYMPHLILLDTDLEREYTGYDVYREIEQTGLRANRVVLGISSDHTREQGWLDIGANGFLFKRILVSDEVGREIQSVLEKCAVIDGGKQNG